MPRFFWMLSSKLLLLPPMLQNRTSNRPSILAMGKVRSQPLGNMMDSVVRRDDFKVLNRWIVDLCFANR